MPIQRVTNQTIKVLSALLEIGEPVWGLELVRLTGLMTGTVYPILERLEEANWLISNWEVQNERSGPRRRLYELTGEGKIGASELIESEQLKANKKVKNSIASKPLEA